MALLDFFKKFSTPPPQPVQKEIRQFNAGNQATEKNMPYIQWFWTAKLGVPRNINVQELRQYAKNSFVQMVINAIIKRASTVEWQIINTDEDDETVYEEDEKLLTDFFKTPNKNMDTFWDMWGMYLRDLLELDAGVLWKGKNGAGELKELYAFDASKFLVRTQEHGIIEGYYQYSYRYPMAKPLFFERDELVYGKINSNTEQFPYGFSPLQSIQQEVELLLQSTRFNKEYFQNNAVPDGLLKVNMNDTMLEKFLNYWKNEIKGKPHKVAIINSPDADFKPFTNTNKDMQWLEGMNFYKHVVFAAYGLSPQEVGYYENSNRSTGESQERITVKNAILPYLAHIENKINREIIPDLIDHDKIRFEFTVSDDVKEELEHTQMMEKLNAGVYEVNEVRRLEGLEDLEVEEVEDDKESMQGEKEEIERAMYTKMFKGYMNGQ